jgi:hypothetical protein
MIAVPSAELDGAALAWAAAITEAREPILLPPAYGLPWRVGVIEAGRLIAWRPERDPLQGHALIGKHRAGINPTRRGWGCWITASCYESNDPDAEGETELVALCRAVAVVTFGETVELPPELAPAAVVA